MRRTRRSLHGTRRRAGLTAATFVVVIVAAGCLPAKIVLTPGLLPHRFLATSATTVFESTDGGDSWHTTTGQPPASDAPTGLVAVAMARDTDVVVGATATGNALWTSADRGTTWVEAKTAASPFVDLSCLGSYCLAVESDGNGFFSASGGLRWNKITAVPLVNNIFMGATASTILPDGHLVVIGSDASNGTNSTTTSTAYRSSDGGQTWQSSTLPAATSFPGESNVVNALAAVGSALVGTGINNRGYPVSVSSDEAVTWSHGGAPNGGYLDDVDDDGSDAVVVFFGPHVMRSADAGSTWTAPTTPVPARSAGSNATYSIAERGDDVVVVGSSAGGIDVSVSHDRGLTWSDAAGQPAGAPNLTSVSH